MHTVCMHVFWLACIFSACLLFAHMRYDHKQAGGELSVHLHWSLAGTDQRCNTSHLHMQLHRLLWHDTCVQCVQVSCFALRVMHTQVLRVPKQHHPYIKDVMALWYSEKILFWWSVWLHRSRWAWGARCFLPSKRFASIWLSKERRSCQISAAMVAPQRKILRGRCATPSRAEI